MLLKIIPLTYLETSQIIEKDITVQGKSLTERLEAINHAQVIDFAKNQLILKKNVEISDILAIHQFILQKINLEQLKI